MTRASAPPCPDVWASSRYPFPRHLHSTNGGVSQLLERRRAQIEVPLGTFRAAVLDGDDNGVPAVCPGRRDVSLLEIAQAPAMCLHETFALCPQMGLLFGLPVAPGHLSKSRAEAAAIWKEDRAVRTRMAMQDDASSHSRSHCPLDAFRTPRSRYSHYQASTTSIHL